MKERLALVVAASFVIAAGGPATALEPVDGLDASGPPVACPNPWDGGSCLGSLAAGTYRTTVFETPFTFTVPEGWSNYEDLPGNFLLLPPGGDIYGVDAGTSDFVGIYQGVGLGANSGTNCDAVEIGPGLDPASMVAALAAREGIIVSDPVPIEIGGLPGLMIDIVDDPSSDAGCRDPEVPFPIKGVIAGLGPLGLVHPTSRTASCRASRCVSFCSTGVTPTWSSRWRMWRLHRRLRTTTSRSSTPSCSRPGDDESKG